MRAHRANSQMRPVVITRQFNKHAEGSVLVEFGDTKVICTVSLVSGVPPFLKGSGEGWLTAEYGMLPRSTHDRMQREAAKGKQSGRTLEIQRLIGRSLRNAIDLKMLGENTLTVDCDVIQADGGTRTAAITGSCVALADAIKTAMRKNAFKQNPFIQCVAAVSVGIRQGEVIVDLDYEEDSSAETDMNVVMNEQGAFIEVQGTAEKNAFTQDELMAMLGSANSAIRELLDYQKQVLNLA